MLSTSFNLSSPVITRAHANNLRQQPQVQMQNVPGVHFAGLASQRQADVFEKSTQKPAVHFGGVFLFSDHAEAKWGEHDSSRYSGDAKWSQFGLTGSDLTKRTDAKKKAKDMLEAHGEDHADTKQAQKEYEDLP